MSCDNMNRSPPALCHVFDREDGCGLMGPALFCPDMVQHGIEPPSNRQQI